MKHEHCGKNESVYSCTRRRFFFLHIRSPTVSVFFFSTSEFIKKKIRKTPRITFVYDRTARKILHAYLNLLSSVRTPFRFASVKYLPRSYRIHEVNRNERKALLRGCSIFYFFFFRILLVLGIIKKKSSC